MKTYFKVVRVAPEGLVSGLVGGLECAELRRYQRWYGTDRWTAGYRGTPVLAFETERAARRFSSLHSGTMQVWQAEAQRPRKINRVGSVGASATRRTFARFWRAVAGMQWWHLGGGYGGQRAPESTVACDAVRLVKRVS
jgi:hypothetical protein